MTQTRDDESWRQVEQVAGEALRQFETIADASKRKLYEGLTLDPTVWQTSTRWRLPSATESLRAHFCRNWQQEG